MEEHKDGLGETSSFANLLSIYVIQLRQNLERVQQASLKDRNPYWHTKTAKENIKALEDSVAQCITAILHYTAALAKYQQKDAMELKAYFLTYHFLFQFQDDIKKHEIIHHILIKDSIVTANFYRFFDQTMTLVQQ